MKKRPTPAKVMIQSVPYESMESHVAIQFGGIGYTISTNLGISEEEGNEVYKGYTEAFPEMFDYFKKVSSESKENGYITFNNITKRKFFFDFMGEFIKLEEKIKQKDFWKDYKKEKDEESTYFLQVLKPMVKKYFKYKGVIERTSYNYPKCMGVTIVIQ